MKRISPLLIRVALVLSIIGLIIVGLIIGRGHLSTGRSGSGVPSKVFLPLAVKVNSERTPTFTTTTATTFTDTPSATFIPAGSFTFTPTPSKTSLPGIVFRKGPTLLFSGSDDQMKIVWQLDSRLTSTLQWGLDTQYSQRSAAVTEYGTDHQFMVTLTGLTPSARYYYRIAVDSGVSTGSFFAAPNNTSSRLKFFAYGDTRTDPIIHDAIAGQIISTYTADPGFQTFVLGVGDLASDGDLETAWTSEFFAPQFANIRKLLANLSFLPVMGNHEGGGMLFTKYFPMPFAADRYWSFDYGPAHFVMLDQYVSYEVGSAQYGWLVNDLSSSKKQWKFIVLHEPGWSAGGGHENNATVQEVIQPLAVQYGVAILFGGHNHYYARAVVNGIQHLTVGGGGAPLQTPDLAMPFVVTASRSYGFVRIMIDGNLLTCTAVRSDGTEIETFEITR